jgi:hypothetical protein
MEKEFIEYISLLREILAFTIKILGETVSNFLNRQ